MKTLTAFVVLCLAVTARAEPGSKPTIFVAPLEGDTSQIQGWQPALGEGLAEMFITELTKLNKFEVLESTALPELIKEIQLGEAGYVGDGEKVAKGGFAGADFMFRGKVTRFGSQRKDVDLTGFVPKSIGRLGVQQTMTDVRIDWRIVDVYSRKVLQTGQAVGTQSGGGFDIGVAVTGHGGQIGFGNKEFMNSALGRATVKALSNIVTAVATTSLPESGRRQAQAAGQSQATARAQATQRAARNTPGKVLAVPAKGLVIVSLGERHGFQTGDKALLYEPIDTKDDQGTVVFTEEKLVGEITLDTVQEDRSKATYAGDADVKNGWVVRAK